MTEAQKAAWVKKKYGDYRGPGQPPHKHSFYELRFAKAKARATAEHDASKD